MATDHFQIVNLFPQVVNEMVDFRHSGSVPLDFLFLMNGFNHALEPVVDACHNVVFFVVDLQQMGIM